MSITQYALFTNTLDLWQEALENIGWSKAEFENLLDDEKYRGIPELLNGKLEFRSRTENREEFLHMIATGGYDEYFDWNTWIMATYLQLDICDLQDTIREGRRAFQEKSTPGSWHENGLLNLVFGIDFFLWGKVGLDPERYTSFDAYDRRYEMVW